MNIRKTAMFLLVMGLLAGCAAAEEHTHVFDQWDRDLHNHWQACACGVAGEGEKEAHTLMEGCYCPVCESEIVLYEEGSGEIYNYNELFDLVRMTFYEEDGQPMVDNRHEYERDAEGRLLLQRSYWNGMLHEEYHYQIGPDGEMLPLLQLGYDEDGGITRQEYNARGEVTAIRIVTADGNIQYEETVEYTYDGEGIIQHIRTVGRFDNGESFIREENKQGDTLCSVAYDENGMEMYAFRNEYSYDEEDNLLWRRGYQGDWLEEEAVYQVVLDEEGSFSFEQIYICYERDGSKTVYEYDVEGNEISIIAYDANGEEIIP